TNTRCRAEFRKFFVQPSRAQLISFCKSRCGRTCTYWYVVLLMDPTVCRCCGGEILTRSGNANLCTDCERLMEDESPIRAVNAVTREDESLTSGPANATCLSSPNCPSDSLAPDLTGSDSGDLIECFV